MDRKDSVHVTSEAFTGLATVEHIYPGDGIAVVRRAAEAQSIARLRRPGALFVVNIDQCQPVAAAPVMVDRHPVKRNASPLVLGLAGPKKVGKSTTADAVRSAFKRRGITAEVRSFAGPIYQALTLITGIPETILRDQTIKDRPLTAVETSNPCLVGKTIRSLLEWLGQGVHTQIGADHWVHRAFVNLPDVNVIIFDDARHDTEFEAIDESFELVRAGCSYPGNHPSAMPPEPKYIKEVIKLDDHVPMEVGEIICASFLKTRIILFPAVAV